MSSLSTLCIGDVISLRIAQPHTGWLSSEGILTDDCILTSEGTQFEHCLWEVTVQHQYNFTKELNEKTAMGGIINSADEEEDEAIWNEKKQEEYMISASINEDRLNEKLMSMKYGKPVAFGDVIQLRHFLSRKYITVSSTTLAKVERRNMRVGMHSRGDSMSWLEFMPRFKYDREGQHISNDTEAFIRIHEKPSEYIHAARKSSKFSIDNSKEINCSLESSCWKINIFQKASDTMSKNILLGHLVSLQEPEASTYLTLDSRKSASTSTLNKANVVMSSSIQLSFSSSDCNVGTNLLWMVEGEDMFQGGAVSNHGSNVALRDLNSGLYMKMGEEGVTAVRNRDECSFFEVSTTQQSDIGADIPDGSIVHLSCQSSFVTMKKGSNAKLRCEGSSDRSSALSMVITSKLQRSLGVDLLAGVEATKVLRRFEALIRTKKIFSLPKSNIEAEIRRFFSCIDLISAFLQPEVADKYKHLSSSEASLHLADSVALVTRQTMLREQGFLIVLLDIIEHCALGTLKRLSENNVRSISFLRRGASESAVESHREEGDGVKDQGEENTGVVDRKAEFLKRKPDKVVTARQSLVLKSTPTSSLESKEARRKQMKLSFLAAAAKMKLEASGKEVEQKPKGDNFLNIVKAASLKKKLFTSKLSKRHTILQTSSTSPTTAADSKHSEGAENTTLPIEIAKVCLEVLFVAIQKNHVSQMAIADYFSVLLNQVKHHREAILCVQEILNDNLQMLQTKIRDREMKIFLDQLAGKDMNVTLLNLLRSSCTCPSGVDNTQRMVVNALFQREILFLKKSSVEKTVGLWRSNSFMQKLRPGTLLEKGGSSEGESQVLEIDTVSKNRQSLAKLKLQQAAKSVALLKNLSSSGEVAGQPESTRRSVLISVSEKRNVVRHVVWSDNRVYFPKSSREFERHVLGNHILKYGIPDLVLNWFSDEKNEEDFSSLTLFGHATDVPFSALFTVKLLQDADEELSSHEIEKKKKRLSKSGDIVVPPPSMSPPSPMTHIRSPASSQSKASSKRLKRMTSSNKKSIARRQSQVVQYFISQMYLVADLCLDRNYIAIGLLEKFYTYSMLLTALKTQDCPASLQAPLMRIIRCLYVDREPQVEAKFPRLVKTSVTLKVGHEDTFEDYHVGSQFKFGILQQMLSDYLHNKLDITNCDELSSEAMELVLCLMKYGYYSNAEQLQDIIHPLVQVLCNHRRGTGMDSVLLNSVTDAPNSDDGEADNDMHDEGFEMFQKPKSDTFAPSVAGQLMRAASYTLTKFPIGTAAKVTPVTDSSNDTSEQNRMTLESLATNVLHILESLTVLIFVLCLVVITTTFTVLGFFHEKNKLIYSSFDLFVSIFFFTEILVRMSCYRIVNKEISPFFSNSLNTLDVVIVVFDIILLSLDPQYFGYAAKFAKSLKVIRIVRLFRVFRAARLLKTIAEKSVVHEEWVMPERYSRTNENEVRTLAGIMKVLKMAHDRMEDQKLSTIFSAYITWKNGRSQSAVEAVAITARAIEEHQIRSASIPPKFDEALTDIIMHSNPILVKEGLNLLRVLQSEELLLTNCLKKIQIISTASSERKYQKIMVNLRKMKKYAETFEIWGSLRNKEHLSIADDLLQMLSDLTDLVHSPAAVSHFDLHGEAVEDVEIQSLMANLDALKDMMSIQTSLLDASIDQMDHIIKRIIVSCNELLCAYVSGNRDNQIDAFKHFHWFLQKIDVISNSSKVVRAIISGNRNLIKQVPHKHLAEFIQKIAVNGQRAEYLDLFVGLTDIEDTGDSSISLLRNEISRYVTNTERSSYMLLWCCARGSKAYEARVQAMAPFLDANDPLPDDELPQDLQYHINLLQLIVGCKLGPKIQAIYPLDDVVAAILDDRTIFQVRNKLGLILLDMVSSNCDAIEASESMWLYFEYVVEFFQEAETDFVRWTKSSKKISKLARANYCEWLRICVSISDIFFSGFDMALFLDTCEVDEASLAITRRSEEDVLEVITNLRVAVNKLLFKHKILMSQQCVATFEQLITALSQLLQHDVEVVSNGDVRPEQDRFVRNRLAHVNRHMSLTEDVKQGLTRRKFQEFVNHISTPPEELQEPSVQTFLKLPEISATVDSDVRFEAFLLKITNYLRTQITKVSNASTLDKSVYPSATWVIQTLRLILEGKIGTKISDLSDPLNLHSEVMCVSWYHTVMNTCGVTYLCLDLIAVGIETALSLEAMKLLILLVSKSGGNLEVQETIYRYLAETDSTLFFEQLKEIIELQIAWCGRFSVDNRKKYFQSDWMDAKKKSYELSDEIYSLKFISAMCEGHFALKKILREQDGNRRFVNIIDQLAHFAETISRMEGHTCTKYAIRIMHTIYVLIRGPCVCVQEHFVLHTDMLTALNRLMRASRPTQNFTNEWGSDLESLKEFVIDVLRVSIEGQPSNSVVVERIKTTIDISLLSVLILPVETDEHGNSLELTDLTRMQAKYLVFLQALDDHDTEMPFNAMERIDKDIAFVEVIWEGQLTVHYFHIPEIAKDLSESSKSVIIAEMNCLSQDLKLQDFIKKATALYREATHQMYLKSYGVSNVWHFIDKVSRIMFINVIVMNIILIVRYVEDSSGNIFLPRSTRNLLLGLNVVHCVLSFNNVVVSLCVRLPVIYSTSISNGCNQVVSMIYALTDILQLWYFVYLGITILAIFKSYLFLSLLLLDFIVLDATSRDVLYAVVIPARQLFSTFIIMIIVLYITAVVIFVFFRNEYLSFEEDNNSMWVSVVLAFNYGIRATEGLGQYMFDTTGSRLVVDTTIYFVLVVILRNIFFGIIINTFGELRNIKKEREEHVSNRCFICGIDRHEYDKMRLKDQGDFKHHREHYHNLWNYLYFVVKIWYQPRNQDTSLEQYVRTCMEKDDTSWFPVGVIGNSVDSTEGGPRGTSEERNDKKLHVSATSRGVTGGDSEDKAKESSNQLDFFSKINEKLSIMERQSFIGDQIPSRNAKLSPDSSIVSFQSHEKDGSRNRSLKSGAKPSHVSKSFVESTVRNETSFLLESLKTLKRSINSCSAKLGDIETSSQRPHRLAGIALSSKPGAAGSSSSAVNSPRNGGRSVPASGGRIPGPSLEFIAPTVNK